jgi:hypothetical protein
MNAFLSLLLVAVAQDAAQMPKPGKEHELLKQLEGKWDVTGKILVDPANPTEIKGTESSKMDLGGFWLRSHFKGEMLGLKFEGRSDTGYSPLKKKYVGSWIDSFMPHLFVMEGAADEAGKVFTFTGEGFDPATGKPAKEKWVIEIKDADTHTMTFYAAGEDGKERKTGELTYKKQPKKKQ